MNERIRELMEQASAGACHDVETNTLIGTEIERFAELIVLECTDKMYKVIQKTEQTDLAYNAMLTAIIADIHQSFDIKDSKADQFTRAMENAFKNGIDLSGQETP